MLSHDINVAVCYANFIILSCIMLMSLHSITLEQLHYTNLMLHYAMLMLLPYANVVMLWCITLCCLPTYMNIYMYVGRYA